MTFSINEKIAIRGIASIVPSKKITNSQIGGIKDREYVESLSLKVGVTERRVVGNDQYSSDLAIAAGKKLLEELSWEASSVDLLIVATQTPDNLFPAVSFKVHRDLGLSKHCVVFDINLGCSAFTHGIWITSTLLASCGSRAILITVDTMSKTLGSLDIGNQVLFGDAGSATGLELDHSAENIYAVTMSDGKGIGSVCLPNSGITASPDKTSDFHINGPAVLGLALRAVPKLISELLLKSEMKIEDIGMFVPHQANLFILDLLAQNLGISRDRTVISMDHFGNTSSSSIPLALVQSQSVAQSLDSQKTLLVGFGTGFSISCLIADLSKVQYFGVFDLEEINNSH